MKINVIILLMLSITVNSCQIREPVFSTLLIEEPEWQIKAGYPVHLCVLVKHIPGDRNTLKKLIIKDWVEKTSMSLDTLRRKNDITEYSISYLKSSYYTKIFFTDEHRHSDYWEESFNRKNFLAHINIEKCENSDSNITVYMRMLSHADIKRIKEIEEYGTVSIFAFMSDIDTLVYECNNTWYNRNRDNELVKYFMELQKVN
jgi:hypothetical protein